MKKSFCLVAGLLALTVTSTFGQPATAPVPPASFRPRFPLDNQPAPPAAPPTLPAPAPPPSGNFSQRLQAIIEAANPPQNQPPPLTKFNLDFPGGTPEELVAAIEKAMGKPINVIIPDEDADTKLPSLKLNEITFPQLSDTLRVGSTKAELIWVRSANGSAYNQNVETGYYFKTTDERPTDNSVWFFRVTKKPEQAPPPPVEKVCQFYSLSPYLDRGFTVDDITTAIQTGWKMAGVTSTPELNYHKETKLLIAFGEPQKLHTIDQVLQTLPQTPFSQPALDRQIKQLQQQIDQLTKKISSSSTQPTTVEIK